MKDRNDVELLKHLNNEFFIAKIYENEVEIQSFYPLGMLVEIMSFTADFKGF